MTQQQEQQTTSLPKSYSLPAQLSHYSSSSGPVFLTGAAPLSISRACTTAVTSIEFGVGSISDFDLLGKGKGVGHSVTGVQLSRRLLAKDGSGGHYRNRSVGSQSLFEGAATQFGDHSGNGNNEGPTGAVPRDQPRGRRVSSTASFFNSSSNKNNINVRADPKSTEQQQQQQQQRYQHQQQSPPALSPSSSTSSCSSSSSASISSEPAPVPSSLSPSSSTPSKEEQHRGVDQEQEHCSSPPSLSSSVSSSNNSNSPASSPASPLSPILSSTTRHPCDNNKDHAVPLGSIKEGRPLFSCSPTSSSTLPQPSSHSPHSRHLSASAAVVVTRHKYPDHLHRPPPITPTALAPPRKPYSSLNSSPTTPSPSSRAPPSPIVIHRSRSITFATPSSPSSAALNISPAECHSLSPSTASPADAAYFAPILPRTLSFRRKTSSFFLSLSSPSSVASLTSLYQSGNRPLASTNPAHFQQGQAQAQAQAKAQAQSQSQQYPKQQQAQYRSPDYLTAYFAETHHRPQSSSCHHKARSSSLSVIGAAGPGLLRTQQQQQQSLFAKQGQDRSRSHSQNVVFSSSSFLPSLSSSSSNSHTHSSAHPPSPSSACLSAPLSSNVKRTTAPSFLLQAPDTPTPAAAPSSSSALLSTPPHPISATSVLSSSPPSLYSVSPPTRPSSSLSSTSSASTPSFSSSSPKHHRNSNRHHHHHYHHNQQVYSTSPSPLGKYSSSPGSTNHSIHTRLHHHHTKHITAIPTTTLNNTHVNSSHSSVSAGTRYRSRHSTTAPSLYRPLMIPRKAKQAVLSLVTTEQPKYGPSRSTQSTVHGGDWGETAIPAAGGQYQQQGVEPNSAGAGQDPWMMVTGSGSSYVSNANTNSAGLSSASGLPSSVGTPLNVREDQLNRMPALQLLDRNADTDPVLDVETAHQIRLELPRKLRNATKWNLVYSSDQHGISMTTLFHRCKGKGPMVLALKDTTDAVFGAFVTEELKPNLTYYGTGECFLWNVTTVITSPQPAPSPSFSPSPMPSPSPFQLSSNVTTPVGRSPSPSPLSTSSATSRTTGNSNNSNGNGGDRRYDLFLAMNDRINTTGRSPSPLSGSPHQQHLVGSPSNSPVIRPSDATSTSNTSPAKPPTSGGRKKKQKVVQFWKWTGKNDYMILSEPGFIGLGGGDGKFGLWLHSDLERGHSARCATFDNEPLAAACRHPIRHMAGGAIGSLAPPVRVAREDTPSGNNSRSSSPKDDKEEFYCQTVEIWSMAL